MSTLLDRLPMSDDEFLAWLGTIVNLDDAYDAVVEHVQPDVVDELMEAWFPELPQPSASEY